MIYGGHLVFLGQWNLEVSHDQTCTSDTDISNGAAETAPHIERVMGG
jgi:hypothetical protein